MINLTIYKQKMVYDSYRQVSSNKYICPEPQELQLIN